MWEISRQRVLEGEIYTQKNVGNLTNHKVWTQTINMWKIIGERWMINGYLMIVRIIVTALGKQ